MRINSKMSREAQLNIQRPYLQGDFFEIVGKQEITDFAVSNSRNAAPVMRCQAHGLGNYYFADRLAKTSRYIVSIFNFRFILLGFLVGRNLSGGLEKVVTHGVV